MPDISPQRYRPVSWAIADSCTVSVFCKLRLICLRQVTLTLHQLPARTSTVLLGDHTNIIIFSASITSTTATIWKAPATCSCTTTSVGQVKMLECRLVLPFQIR